MTEREAYRPMDRSALDNRFDGPYMSGERIEVTYEWDETKRGYVGRTTGWKPVYILLSNTRSLGSSDILDHHVTQIRRNVSVRRRVK